MKKTKLIILGCGSSIGVPRIDGHWGNCKKKNSKNFRTRCSAIIIKGKNSILIDTSPDIKQQFLTNNIKNVSSVLYTHEHADQTHGINELRPFFWKNNKKINIYSNSRTIKFLIKSFSYLFKSENNYPAFLKTNIVKKKFFLGSQHEKINFETIDVDHGAIKTTGYIFKNVAYLSDCNKFSNSQIKKLRNIKYLIIDCLKFKKHPSHFSLYEVLAVIKKIKPKNTILTNLHSDLDYNFLLKILPRNVKPAYDGLTINI